MLLLFNKLENGDLKRCNYTSVFLVGKIRKVLGKETVIEIENSFWFREVLVSVYPR